MITPITFGRPVQGLNLDGRGSHAGHPAGDAVAPADGSSIRWVFAATVLFWVVVYAAGRSFF